MAELAFQSAAGRWVLAATVLGSGLAHLDATVVNIALPAIGAEFGGGLAALQWIVNGYTLTLAALLLLGGALGDRYGRRRIFMIGIAWFTVASIACGVAPSAGFLIAARVAQGIGAALLTPTSLAILESGFREEDRSAAIGAWSGLGGVAIAIGPFAGGYLIGAVSWRLVFFINIPIAIAVMLIARRHVPETRDPEAPPRLDLTGAALAALGLGGVTYALIEASRTGASGVVFATGAAGLAALVAFVAVEHLRRYPMMDLALFRSRLFSATNVETLAVYAALGGGLFLVPIQLQVNAGYSPLAAGAALLPTTAMMLLLSSRMGRLSQQIGPKVPMTVGPLIAAAGLWLLGGIGGGAPYQLAVLPGTLVLGLGLATTVAPLTATVLAAAPAEKAGLASAVNNCLARTGGLVAVAALPVAAGMSAGGDLAAEISQPTYQRGMQIAAGLAIAGGLIALVAVTSPARAERRAVGRSCPLDAPPLRMDPHRTRTAAEP